MNQVECGRNAVWGGCEECLINSHFQSARPLRDYDTEGLIEAGVLRGPQARM